MKVTDENDFLSSNNTIRANNKIVTERTWTGLVTSKFETQPLESNTDDQLHDERVVAVREEPSLHVNPISEMSQSRSSRLHVRMSKKSGWNIVSRLASNEEHAGTNMLWSDKTGTRTQSTMTIESRLPWCETLEQGLLLFRSTKLCSARQIILVTCCTHRVHSVPLCLSRLQQSAHCIIPCKFVAWLKSQGLFSIAIMKTAWSLDH